MSEEKRDSTKEQIKFNTELIKVLTLFFIATVGGSLSLVLQGLIGARAFIFAFLGLIVSLATLRFTISLYLSTQKLIKELKK